MESSCLKKIMRLAQLDTPNKEVAKRGGGLRIASLDFFTFADKKNNSIIIKFCSLLEEGIYTVKSNFEENLTKNYFFIYIFISVITFVVVSSYYKM